MNLNRIKIEKDIREEIFGIPLDINKKITLTENLKLTAEIGFTDPEINAFIDHLCSLKNVRIVGNKNFLVYEVEEATKQLKSTALSVQKHLVASLTGFVHQVEREERINPNQTFLIFSFSTDLGLKTIDYITYTTTNKLI